MVGNLFKNLESCGHENLQFHFKALYFSSGNAMSFAEFSKKLKIPTAYFSTLSIVKQSPSRSKVLLLSS